MNPRRVLVKALSGSKTIWFAEMVALVQAFGFELDRINGSHHIFKHPRLRERVNLQRTDGRRSRIRFASFSISSRITVSV